MRIKINDKIYRLEEIESGVDSLMELVEEPRYKDEDFVVNMAGDILIFREKVGVSIYDHAYLTSYLRLFIRPALASTTQIERYVTEEEKQKLLDALAKKGKRWNEEEKCVEDIPVRKFKDGDKVMLKSGCKHDTMRRMYSKSYDRLVGEPLLVNCYDKNTQSYYFENFAGILAEDWLESYAEKLKAGDLAIFWDENEKYARAGIYAGKINTYHYDHTDIGWANAIKFESKEQYERLIKGEI